MKTLWNLGWASVMQLDRRSSKPVGLIPKTGPVHISVLWQVQSGEEENLNGRSCAPQYRPAVNQQWTGTWWRWRLTRE
jgi:hypothetical protein